MQHAAARVAAEAVAVEEDAVRCVSVDDGEWLETHAARAARDGRLTPLCEEVKHHLKGSAMTSL